MYGRSSHHREDSFHIGRKTLSLLPLKFANRRPRVIIVLERYGLQVTKVMRPQSARPSWSALYTRLCEDCLSDGPRMTLMPSREGIRLTRGAGSFTCNFRN